jgi:hypothetical protein
MAINDEKNKVFDVEKPGKAKPDMGSKPMIVGHLSMSGDPMVKLDDQKEDKPPVTPEDGVTQTDNVNEVRSPSKVKIEPLSEEAKSEIEVSQPKEELAEEEKLEEETKVSEDNAPNLEKENESTKLEPEAIAMEREENLNKIIQSKKYNVDIKESRSGSIKTFIYVFLGLVIAGFIALFILIDTNTIETDIDLPFRIFGSEEKYQESGNSELVNTENPQDIKETPLSNSWYEHSTENYSIRLADGWELLQTDTTLFGDSLTYIEGQKATVTEESQGRDGICCFSVTYDTILREQSVYDDSTIYTKSILKNENGQDIIRYVYEITSEPEATVPPEGSLVYDYFIEGINGDGLFLSYTKLPDADNILELVEQVIVTATIK